jgi:predicted phage terminase large subunit-like protein
MTKDEKYIQMGRMVLAQDCKDRFYSFVLQFWEVIIKEPFSENWHIEYLCDEMQKLSEYIVKRLPKPYDLIINIPPGTTKSTIVTIMFHPWLWTIDPTIKVITNSYSNSLSIEHATKSKDIILSDKYRALFPEVEIRRDKSGKQNYENTLTGFRYATSTGSTITGFHAHIILNDDPQNPKQANSELLRLQAIEHVKTLSSRKVDKENTPMITIMQRLNEQDVTGYLLAQKQDTVRHLCLPAEATGSIKPESLRSNYVDGMLDPKRLSRKVLAEAKTDLGSRAYSGQFDQNPVTEGGNIIKNEWFKYVSYSDFRRMAKDANPPVIFFIDTAYTDSAENDPSGIIGACRIENALYIVAAKKVSLRFPDLIKFIPGYVQAHGYSSISSIRIEPKANGISVVDQLARDTELNVCSTPTPRDSKETRLNSISPLFECGRIYLVADNWNDEFVGEITGFPTKAHDEYVDLIYYAADYLLNAAKEVDEKELLNIFR